LAKRDFYEVLGVSKTATLEVIKKAYRQKAVLYHPDKNPGDKESEEKFKEATDAYSILSNPDQRSKYDQFGHAAFEQGRGGFQDFGDFSGFEDIFGDIFSSFFGGSGGGRAGVRGGRDLRYDLEVTFEEAAFGVEKNIKVDRQDRCDVCSGSGAVPGSSAETCPTCGGVGQTRVQQGFFTIARTCSSCGGAGKIIKDPCKTCHGSGTKRIKHSIKVKVPAGIDHGQRLKIRGEGEPGQGGPAGDLYVQIFVKDHVFFHRENTEIICEFPISYSTAVLGGEVEVPTLDGVSTMKIPAGTQSGKIFRLRSKGVPVLGSSRRGDQHVKVFIDVPKKISEEKRRILEQLQEAEAKEPALNEKGFFDKVKNMF